MIATKATDVLVSEAAKTLGVTPGRVRQLCGEMNLGRMLTKRLRVISPSELRAIKKRLDNTKKSRPKRNSEKTIDNI